MTVEYAPKGLIGVLTPQANTTVEPEFAILTPKGMAFVNARLTSDKGTIEARLVDYFDRLDGAVRQFANAPIGVVAVACTGASYLAGVDREDAIVAETTRAAKVPVVTSGLAVTDALNALGARRIGLVSPYTASLDAAAVPYWRARGFDVASLVSAFRESDAFHPIYSLPSAAADEALERVPTDLDAVVMLGTGMPTLNPIRKRPFVGRAPVISCMLATAWRAVAAIEGRGLDAEGVMAWVRAERWGGIERL